MQHTDQALLRPPKEQMKIDQLQWLQIDSEYFGGTGADNWNEVASRFVGSATANRIELELGVSFGERYTDASR